MRIIVKPIVARGITAIIVAAKDLNTISATSTWHLH